MTSRRRRTASYAPSDGQAELGEQLIDTQAFFESKKAAAVLKHEILRGYVPPFAGKTGKKSPEHRVVIVDGFAGAGRYGDGAAGSPAIFADAAKRTPSRDFECYFVEKDSGNYQSLRAVLEREGDAITWEAWPGSVYDHMDEILSRADGLPMFMFIDPYGIGPDFTQVGDIFQRRPGGRRTPATELLFRVDANALRRTLGVHRSPSQHSSRDGQLRRVDDLAGGTWWRDQDDGIRVGEAFLEWFFDRYLTRLAEAIGCNGWFTDVKQKPHHQPAYYLVFLTRHVDGVEVFGDTLSRAMGKWRRAVFNEAVEAQRRTGQDSLMDPDDEFTHAEQQLAVGWQRTIEANLRALLGNHERFVLREHYNDVFGTTIGHAREMHVRAALKALHAAGITSSNGTGEVYPKTIVRAPGVHP